MAEKKPKRKIDALNPKHKDFVLNYIKNGGNAVRAYMSVYPNSKYSPAGVNGQKLLKKAKISEALQEYYDLMWAEKEKVIGKTFSDLVDMAQADIADVVEKEGGQFVIKDFSEIPNTGIIKKISRTVVEDDKGRRVSESVEIVDKLKAINDLSKQLGMVTDKVEHTGTIEIIPPVRPKDD